MPPTASDAFYQWSALHSLAVRATAPSPSVDGAPEVSPEATGVPALDAPSPERLTDRLNAKLHELRVAGFTILWIEAELAAFTTLIMEGGEEAILLDPDPDRDVAWYGGCHIRHASEPGVRVYLEGETDGISWHVV